MVSYLDYVDKDPYAYYTERLQAGPIHWDEGMRAWLVFGYEEARFVATRQDYFGHPYNDFRGAKEVQGGTRGILMLQGEEHDRMHNFLLSHFTPTVVRRYREQLIAPIVGRRLDEIGGRSRVDLADQLAAKVPSDVIAALLGLDWDDEELLDNCRDWNHALFRWSETFGEDDDALAESLDAAERLNAVLLPVIRARKTAPRDDLISVLWEKGPQILSPWTEEEVLAQCRVLFFAGADTTQHFLRNAIYVLMTQPHWQSELRGDQAKISDFVDEVLRYYSPVHFRVRVALTDVMVGDQLVKAGDRLHPMNAAANRDPRHYPDPNVIQPRRKPLRDHLAFNVGPRFCVGAALARGEGVEAIKLLLDRVEQFVPDAEASGPEFIGHMPRSHRPLNVVLTPRAALV
jgi:cytochrome P450